MTLCDGQPYRIQTLHRARGDSMGATDCHLDVPARKMSPDHKVEGTHTFCTCVCTDLTTRLAGSVPDTASQACPASQALCRRRTAWPNEDRRSRAERQEQSAVGRGPNCLEGTDCATAMPRARHTGKDWATSPRTAQGPVTAPRWLRNACRPDKTWRHYGARSRTDFRASCRIDMHDGSMPAFTVLVLHPGSHRVGV